MPTDPGAAVVSGVRVWRTDKGYFVPLGYTLPKDEPGTWYPQAEADARDAEVERLRSRIHEIQRNADQRNAELHKRVAYYESIRDRTNEIVNRFKTETPLSDTDPRRFIEWFADEEHTRALVEKGYAHPGNTIGFWVAFRMVLEADDDARDAVIAAAREARQIIVDLTFVGTRISREPYPTTEAKKNSLACNAAITLKNALDRLDAEATS